MRCTLLDFFTAKTKGPESSEPEGKGSRRIRPSRRILAVAAIVVVVTGFVAAAYAFHILGLGLTNCWARPASEPNTAIFTVVMANEGLNVGYNGSRYHAFPWPVMNVSLGQNVIIHVMNNDTTQPHGFAITHFLDSGITVRPGECYDVRFSANTLGPFTVFCNIFCTIHSPWMQNGRLNVDP